MKKFLILFLVMFLGLGAFAGDKEEVRATFDRYVKSANTYNNDLIDYYSPKAKIIRVVEKPDGTKPVATFGMKDYEGQLKLGAAVAKMRNYKNYYTDISIVKVASGYKVNCKRQPSTETYKIPAHFVFAENPNGKWWIVEESMNTKVQTFLKYVK